jgi:hypothetical protein
VLKRLFLHRRLKALMYEGCEITAYTTDGHSCRGKIIEVDWFWLRMMMCEENTYSSWLVDIDAITLLCDFSRDAKQSFISAKDSDDGEAGSMVLK